jgi:hypothetical protein
MLEFAVVASIIVSVWIIGSAATLTLSASLWTQLGLLLLAIGILEGIPTGLYYHIVLYRILHPRGLLPGGWWRSPQQYHVHLTEEEGRRVRRWFVLGGIGFFLCLAGGILALTGMYSGR